jgi:F-type H+-transporting ATPase subunit epsilon
MAEPLHLNFVSPEAVLFSGEVDQVDLPGAEGDLGIFAAHAPAVTVLRPGIVTIYRGGARELVVVTGGFAEVGPAGLTILADRAVARDDFDTGTLATEIKDTEEDLADSTDQAQRDKLARHLEQLRTLQAALAGAGAPAH